MLVTPRSSLDIETLARYNCDIDNHSISFNFHGVWARVHSPERELLRRIEWDFSHFLERGPREPHFQFYAEQAPPPWQLLPSAPVSFQSLQSMTYRVGHQSFNDYYRKALTIYDYREERGQLYSEDLHKLHEITYLMILSRVGKRLDLQGLHKLHAFGIVKNQTALLGIMPMKGGKSTHFLQFIQDPEVAILSDDTPLISRWGQVLPFPLRVGVEGDTPTPLPGKAKAYQLRREHYGPKTLISIGELANPIGGNYQRCILFRGVRSNRDDCQIRPVSKLALLGDLIKFQVIGLGLPIILEYFWESGLRDLGRKSLIALSRFQAALLLLLRAKTYTVFMGTNPRENVRVMRETFLSEDAHDH